jgi:hypothetical protein
MTRTVTRAEWVSMSSIDVLIAASSAAGGGGGGGGGGCSGCGVGGAGQRWLSELAAAALELPTDEHVRSSSPAPMRHDK